ncbi:hypothetical protein GBA52_010517 [Prunus armeniaca]|nr:hypothetical protein GBA52_010517 [Prunus armeniaca]
MDDLLNNRAVVVKGRESLNERQDKEMWWKGGDIGDVDGGRLGFEMKLEFERDVPEGVEFNGDGTQPLFRRERGKEKKGREIRGRGWAAAPRGWSGDG